MKIIDAHWHYFLDQPERFEQCLAECKKYNVVKVCVAALGEQFNDKFADNRRVRNLIARYPDLIIGFGFINLGHDRPGIVRALHCQGFRGIKVINPLYPYGDRRLFGVYAEAQRLGMPVLFHTGWVASHNDRKFDVDCERMNPIHLDTIARYFPDLKIIGAHLGGFWCEIACKIARQHRNVYFDLSGGTIRRRPYNYFRHLFSDGVAYGRVSVREKVDPALFKKFVYGTDNETHRGSIIFYKTLMQKFKINMAIQENVFYNNLADMLKIK